jgi:SagB-type dehydrogenase family enzyme
MKDWVDEDVSETFHLCSNNQATNRRYLSGHKVHYDAHVTALYQEQFAVQQQAEDIKLPLNLGVGRLAKGLEGAILNRRSSRAFGSASLELDEISKILFLACGVNNDGSPRRNTPNSGGLGSVELFLIVQNIKGLSPGIYFYDSVRHSLIKKREGFYQTWLSKEVFYQHEFSLSAAVICLAVDIRRLKAKYGIRGYRLGLLDAGHVSQNINLVACALDLAVCSSAGFIDNELNDAFELDGVGKAVVLTVMIAKQSDEKPAPDA